MVWTYPANEAVDVPRTFTIRVQFDRFLMPSTAVRQAMCLQAATVGGENTGTEHCISAGFAPQYDPVDRVATWAIRGQLEKRTRYNVRLFAAKDAQDPNGVRAIDGVPLEKELTFAFTTGDGEPPLDPPRTFGFCTAKELCPLPGGACDEPTPTAVTASLHDYLATSCTGGGNCHGTSARAPGISGAVLRFDDDGAGGGLVGAVRHLVDHAVVATESATGIDPVAPSRNVLAPFGRNMPYIDATNPGNSFLLYKMILALAPRCPFDANEESALRDPSLCASDGSYTRGTFATDFYDCRHIDVARLPRDGTGRCPSDAGFPEPPQKRGSKGELISPVHEPWVPADAWQPPAHGEYDRLRTRIRGSGMPHGGVVSRADALSVSAWIADGARVDGCPPLADQPD